jgi:putative peptidoglycan binding protein
VNAAACRSHAAGLFRPALIGTPALADVPHHSEVLSFADYFKPNSFSCSLADGGNGLQQDSIRRGFKMRYFIVLLSLIFISFSAPEAKAHLSAGVDPATFSEEANQTTEDQIRLNRTQRREVQRRLNGLGFETKATGKFDNDTRAAIERWQAARGYPKSGYFNKLQHKALLSEPKVATQSSGENSGDSQRRRNRRSGALPNPVSVIGGVVGGIFRH